MDSTNIRKMETRRVTLKTSPRVPQHLWGEKGEIVEYLGREVVRVLIYTPDTTSHLILSFTLDDLDELNDHQLKLF